MSLVSFPFFFVLALKARTLSFSYSSWLWRDAGKKPRLLLREGCLLAINKGATFGLMSVMQFQSKSPLYSVLLRHTLSCSSRRSNTHTIVLRFQQSLSIQFICSPKHLFYDAILQLLPPCTFASTLRPTQEGGKESAPFCSCSNDMFDCMRI